MSCKRKSIIMNSFYKFIFVLCGKLDLEVNIALFLGDYLDDILKKQNKKWAFDFNQIDIHLWRYAESQKSEVENYDNLPYFFRKHVASLIAEAAMESCFSSKDLETIFVLYKGIALEIEFAQPRPRSAARK